MRWTRIELWISGSRLIAELKVHSRLDLFSIKTADRITRLVVKPDHRWVSPKNTDLRRAATREENRNTGPRQYFLTNFLRTV